MPGVTEAQTMGCGWFTGGGCKKEAASRQTEDDRRQMVMGPQWLVQ